MKKIFINSFFESPNVINKSDRDFSFAWLFYPTKNCIHSQNQNDYIYGAIINKLILSRSEICKKRKIDFCIITPENIQPHIDRMISSYFDIHVSYANNIQSDFTRVAEKYWSCDQKNKWDGVMNKLYVLHPDLFGCYKKVILLDSDLMIRNAEKYLLLFDEMDTPSGVYEYSNRLIYNKVKTHLVYKNFRNNQIIPKKYCTANTAHYHCINASLLILKANINDYNQICKDISSPQSMYKHMPQLENHILYFPEQEFLTNFYAGRWHSIDFKFLSTIDSPYHIAGKFWTFDFFDRRTSIPSEFWCFFLECSGDSPAQSYQ
jgi:hypothetical protein